MSIETTPAYPGSLFEPLKYWLLGYDAAGGGENRSVLCRILGVDESCDDWEMLSQAGMGGADEANNESLCRFEHACLAFDLNPFERFALTLTFAYEIDARYNACVRILGGGAPTLGFMLRLYSKNPEEAYALRIAWISRESKLGLLFSGDTSEDSSKLTLRRSVLRFLLGLDFAIPGVTLFRPGEAALRDLASSEAYLSVSKLGDSFDGVVILFGKAGSGRKHQLRLFSSATGIPVLFSDMKAAGSKDTAAALMLSGGYLCVCDAANTDDIKALLDSVGDYARGVFLTTEEDGLNVPGDCARLDFLISAPGARLRRGIWDTLLRERGFNVDASAVSDKYAFTIGKIKSALASAMLIMQSEGREALTPKLLEAGCRGQLPNNVSSLAKTVPAVFTWDDLVLPEAQKRELVNASNRVRYESLVYEDWGLAKRVPYGRGVRMLFTGPPGTGKTMAAQVIANELGMELFKIDLSSLVSKYIGETEKNLASIFDGAGRSGGILFFDEADALFGKRGEQKDSHDRFANMQTSYLLQAVEDYTGVLILATNLVQNFDTAFMRRIQCRIDFVPPSREHRLAIWEKLLGGGIPLRDDIDCAFLADTFELTGAEIKNIVLTAAFLAAGRGESVGMGELIQALLTEYAKSGKIISKLELGEYAI